MAISGKDATRQILDSLPDDATLEDIMYALYVRQKIEAGLRNIEAGNTVSHEDVVREINEWLHSAGADLAASRRARSSLAPGEAGDHEHSDVEDVTYHLEQRGRFTVLVPDRPVPPLPATFVEDVVEEMRREREDRWLGLTDRDGE